MERSVLVKTLHHVQACDISILLYLVFHRVYKNDRGLRAPGQFGRYLLRSPSQRGAPALPHPIEDLEFLIPTQPWIFQVFNIS